MTALDWLKDRTDTRVLDALGRRCTICGAKSGSDCTGPTDSTPRPNGAVVHRYRTKEGE